MSWSSRRLRHQVLLVNKFLETSFPYLEESCKRWIYIIIPSCIYMKSKFNVWGSEANNLWGFKLWSLNTSSRKKWEVSISLFFGKFLFRIYKGVIRGGCSGLPLLPMQHLEMAHINFQSSVFVSKRTVNKILKLDQK